MSIHEILDTARASGNPEILRAGLETIDPYTFDVNGMNILHLLIEDHHDLFEYQGEMIDDSSIPYITVLIDYGYDLNRLTECGNRSALHIATSECKDSLIRILVTHGADINCLNNIGCPPLFWVGWSCEYVFDDQSLIDTFNTLCQLGARTNIFDFHGKSLLHIYAYGSSQETYRYPYIKHGVRESIPFFQIVIETFMKTGLNPMSIDDNPRDIALKRNHHQYVAMIDQCIRDYESSASIKEPGVE